MVPLILNSVINSVEKIEPLKKKINLAISSTLLYAWLLISERESLFVCFYEMPVDPADILKPYML